MEKVIIHTEYIQLDQLLKFHGIISTGGQIKPLIEEGVIKINGIVCREKRKKVYPKDIVSVKGSEDIQVIYE